MAKLKQTTEFTATGTRISSDKLKLGYWYVSHKLLIRKIVVFVLFVVNIILVLIVIYGLLDYYLISRPKTQEMYAQLTSAKLNYEYLYEASQPMPITIADTKVLNNNGKYNFAVEIVNPNETWYVPKLTYHFQAGGFVSESFNGFLLPDTTKNFIELGVEADDRLVNAQFIVDEIKWEKVAYFSELRDKILNLEIKNAAFFPANQSGVSGDLQVSRVDFEVSNNSAYNFWDVNFNVLLLQGNKVAYVNKVPLIAFDSGVRKEISFNVYQKLPSSMKVIVEPDVDILNPESFRGYDRIGD